MTVLNQFKKTDWSFITQTGLAFLGSTYLFLFAGTLPGLMNINFQLINLVIVLFFLTVWILKPERFTPSFHTIFLLWSAAYLISVVFSIDPRRSIDQFGLMLGGAFIFCATNTLAHTKIRKSNLYLGLSLTGIIFMFYAWFDFLNWYRLWLQAAPQEWIPSILYRPEIANVIAPLLNLYIVITLVSLFSGKHHRFKIILLSIYLLSALFLLYLTSSRGGWIGAVAAIICFILLKVYEHRASTKFVLRRFKNRPWILALGGLGVLLILTGFVFVLMAQSSHPTHGAILTSRQGFWQPAFQEFLNDPLTGTGSFTYGTTFITHQSVPFEFIYAHAHGTPVNLLTEIGLLGFIAASLLLGSVVLSLLHHLRKDPHNMPAQIGLTALTAISFHAIFDCFHLEPSILWFLLILLGLAFPPAPITPLKPSKPWLFILLPVLMVVNIWMQIPYQTALRLANHNQWQEAVSYYEKAVQRDPWLAINHQQLGLAYAVLAEQQPEVYVDKAITSMQRTIELDPAWSLNHYNLGILYARSGKYDSAQAAINTAIQKAPNAALYYFELGKICEIALDLACAQQAYRDYLDLQSAAFDGTFWQETAYRQGVLAAWQKSNPQPPPLTLSVLQENLKRAPNRMTAYNDLIEYYLDHDQPSLAQPLMAKAGFSFAGKPEEIIQLDLLKARLRDSEKEVVYVRSLFGPSYTTSTPYEMKLFRRRVHGVALLLN